MKKFFFLFLLITASLLAQDKSINIIPQPVNVQQSEGFYTLSNSTTISFNKPESQKIAEMLSIKLNTATGFSIKAEQGKNGVIQLNLNATPDKQLGKEGYTFESSKSGIIISANQYGGLFNGVQTLLQLLPKEIESKKIINSVWNIPAVKITDYPRFGWRGLMLDVSRNFFSKEDVKNYIAEMSKYKFNVFHWHLTDNNGWRIEIKSLPKLTEVGAWRVPRIGRFNEREAPKPGEAATDGGFYTQEDIKEIVKFAQERNITIVPEIDVPGHSMAAIASYPYLSCGHDTSTKVNPGSKFSEWYGNGTFKMLIENALNPSDEKVYEFLDKVFTEMATLFPGQYFHVGGDECYKGFWQQDPGCKELMKKLKIRHVEDLQGYFMNRIEKILKTKNKKMIGWDEILEGGISPEATVMSWRGVKGGIEAAELGHDVVMTPYTFAYLDYNQGDQTVDVPIYDNLRVSKTYSFEPVPEGVNPKYILGGGGNLWTEQISTLHSAEYMTYPRGWALSEVYWSPKEKKNWDDFSKRMEMQFERSEIAEVNYCKAIYDAIVKTKWVNGKLVIEMGTEIPDLVIYYTINETMPDKYGQKYTQPFELPDGPITLRVVTYRNGKPIGHLITLSKAEMEKRAGK